MDLTFHKKKASELFHKNKKLAQKLKKKKPKNLDTLVTSFHEDAFQHIDCLSCANCCKSISPIVRDKDIQRIAKHLKIKPGDFVASYLHLDQEGDYVFKVQPCPFLGEDHYCSIYTVRPKACAEYPHTDRPRFFQILDLSLKNTLICPAVEEVFENLRKEFN
jgi:hypothetical protein